MGFLVEKSAVERLESKCFYLQYCEATFIPHPLGGIRCFFFSLEGLGWGGIQMTESTLLFIDSQIKISFTKL